jgi:N-acetylglucosaminyldiphosphoundecaprenol N-acetyl-beta-D-mannosaminyltransferase
MDMTRIHPQRIRLFGEPVDLTTPTEVLAFVARKVTARQRAIIANHNTHSLYMLGRTPGMRDFYERADLIELDSVPMILWGKLTRKSVSRSHRCTYLDWRHDFWSLAAKRGWRVFSLGGAPGVPELAAERMRARHPGVTIGYRHGYFDAAEGSAENDAVIAQINVFRPDIVFVGMGMPRQELWIAQNYDRLTAGVVFSVGAAFDYEAGVQTIAPRWLSRIGFEWAFRLCHSPRRLASRYLVEPWWLLPAAARDLALAYTPRRSPPRRAPSLAAQRRNRLG